MDILHTNAKGRVDDGGMRKAVGHVDFYPNDGDRQDGCDDNSKILSPWWLSLSYFQGYYTEIHFIQRDQWDPNFPKAF